MRRTRSRELEAEALVQLVAGALFGLLMWWLDGRGKEQRCMGEWSDRVPVRELKIGLP